MIAVSLHGHASRRLPVAASASEWSPPKIPSDHLPTKHTEHTKNDPTKRLRRSAAHPVAASVSEWISAEILLVLVIVILLGPANHFAGPPQPRALDKSNSFTADHD